MIKRRVLQYLQTPALSWLDNASKTMTSSELMQAIKEYAIKQNGYAKGRATISAKHTAIDAYAALSRVNPEIWNQLPADVRKIIIDKRRKELEEERNNSSSKEQNEKPPTSLPKQYNRVANMTTQEVEEAMDHLTPEELDGIDDFIEQYYSHEDNEESDSSVNVAVTITEHQAQLLHASEDGIYHPAIIDNGADTCVLGKGWELIAKYPNRKANVIGFDNDIAVKRHLPIVSAITAVDVGDDTYLLRVNEAVYNESAQHSLLSDYQLRERERVPKLDCVSLRHGGKQEITLSEDVKIPLNIKNCMVNFKHRLPTNKELDLIKDDHFNVLELTQDAPWSPSKHTDEERQLIGTEDDEELESIHMGFHTKTLTFYDPTDTNVVKTTPGNYVDLSIQPEREVIDLTLSEDNELEDMEEDINEDGPEVIDLTEDSDEEDTSAYNVNIQQTFGLTPLAKEDDKYQYNVHRALPSKVDYEKISPYFGFRPKRIIQETLRNTTQLAKSVIRQPMRRHLLSRFQMLRRPRLNEIVATDTYFSPVTSLEGYNCAQVFLGLSSRILDTRGMSTESEYINSLQDFIRCWGIPHTIRRDNAKSETSEKVQNLHRDLIIDDEFTEPHHPQQNPAEVGGVKYLKDHAEILMNRTNSPENTWFLCHQYLAKLHNMCANPSINYKIPHQMARGETPDISHLLLFYWFQPVLYLDPEATFPETKEKAGYFVGFADGSGDALTFKILTEDLKTVLVRSVVRPANSTKNRNRRVTFKSDIEEILNKSEEIYQTERELPSYSPKKLENRIKKIKEIGERNKKRNVASRTRSREHDNKDVAARTRNKQKAYMNRKVYQMGKDEGPNKRMKKSFMFIKDQVSLETPGEVEEPLNGGMDIYKGSTENIGEQMKKVKYLNVCDTYCENEDPMSAWEDSNLTNEKLWNVKAILRYQSRGDKYKFKCIFNDLNKSVHWVDMDALVLQDPVPILQFARRNHIINRDPFRKLVAYCTGKTPMQYVWSYKTKAKTGGAKYKFGIQVPFSIKQALNLDRKNGNTLWLKAIKKELDQLNEFHTFKVLKRGEKAPDGYQQIPYHIVFDVKFDLRRKARLVAGGNWTDLEKDDIYSGVVGLDTIRMGLFLGQLNKLQCCTADIGNAYLNSRTREKVYIIAGPEFGDLEGLILIIEGAIYGLRTSAARFWEHLAHQLKLLGFSNSKADHCLWYRKMDDHYEYIATWVDDVLHWSRDPMTVMNELKKVYTLKGLGIPEYYLGGDIQFLDEHWEKENINMAFSAQTYIKNVIPKYELLFEEVFKPVKTPMAEDYHPEMDESDFLDAEGHAKYRSIIGSLNWIVTLGRFDIHYATSTLARFSMQPREGHLKAAKKVLGYLKKLDKGRIIFDTSIPEKIGTSEQHDWTAMYPDAEEEMPPDVLEPLGKEVQVTAYVDADHAHDLVTRRSVTAILILLNNTPYRWISKRQKTVETSTYGSELVAARIATEVVMEIRYQLRMLGVPIKGPTMMYGDNNSVVLNTTVPSSVLKKKHNAIAYHRVREAIAAGIITFTHVRSEENYADVLSKPLSHEKFHNLVRPFLFRKPSHIESGGTDKNSKEKVDESEPPLTHGSGEEVKNHNFEEKLTNSNLEKSEED